MCKSPEERLSLMHSRLRRVAGFSGWPGGEVVGELREVEGSERAGPR